MFEYEISDKNAEDDRTFSSYVAISSVPKGAREQIALPFIRCTYSILMYTLKQDPIRCASNLTPKLFLNKNTHYKLFQ